MSTKRKVIDTKEAAQAHARESWLKKVHGVVKDGAFAGGAAMSSDQNRTREAVAETPRIDDETNEAHRRYNATMQWLQSVESGCRLHEPFILSTRWTSADRQIIERVAEVMAGFSRNIKCGNPAMVEMLARADRRARVCRLQKETQRQMQRLKGKELKAARTRFRWLKELLAMTEWIEDYVGDFNDAYLDWYLEPNTPGWFDHGLTSDRMENVIRQIERVRDALKRVEARNDRGAT